MKTIPATPPPWRSALLLVALLGLALLLKLDYQRAFEAREPLADAPFGDAAVFLDEARRHFGAADAGTEAAPFYKPPATSWLLSVTGAHDAAGRTRVRRLQLAMGLCVLALVFLLARRRGGDAAGAAAFLLLLFHAPPTFQETKLLDSTLSLFLSLLAVSAFDRAAARRAGPLAFLATGLLFGVAALARPANLLLAPALLLCVRDARRVAPAAALLLGAIVPVVPVTLHNARAGGGFVPVNFSEGHTFLAGNHPGARGIYSLPPGYPDGVPDERAVEFERARISLGRAPTAAEQRDHSYAEGLRHLAAEPLRVPALLLDKLRFALSSREIDDNDSLPRERRLGLLRAFRLPFGLLLALGAAAFAFSSWRGKGVLLTPLLVTLATLLVFYVASRYRLPAAPFLAAAAGVGLAKFRAAPAAEKLAAAVVAVTLLAGSYAVPLPYKDAELQTSERLFDEALGMYAEREARGG